MLSAKMTKYNPYCYANQILTIAAIIDLFCMSCIALSVPGRKITYNV